MMMMMMMIAITPLIPTLVAHSKSPASPSHFGTLRGLCPLSRVKLGVRLEGGVPLPPPPQVVAAVWRGGFGAEGPLLRNLYQWRQPSQRALAMPHPSGRGIFPPRAVPVIINLPLHRPSVNTNTTTSNSSSITLFLQSTLLFPPPTCPPPAQWSILPTLHGELRSARPRGKGWPYKRTACGVKVIPTGVHARGDVLER